MMDSNHEIRNEVMEEIRPDWQEEEEDNEFTYTLNCWANENDVGSVCCAIQEQLSDYDLSVTTDWNRRENMFEIVLLFESETEIDCDEIVSILESIPNCFRPALCDC
jgi:hypothetical protein